MTTRHYTERMSTIIRHYTFRGAMTTRQHAEKYYLIYGEKEISTLYYTI